MKTSRFWGYFAKLGLGTGVAVGLAGAPVLAHAEDNTPSGAIQRGGAAAGSAAESAGNAAGNAATNAGNAAGSAADQAGSAASGAAQKGADEVTGAANKASDTASSAADEAQGAADKAQGAADRAQGAADRATTGATGDSSITDGVKAKLAKNSGTSDIKVDTDNGVVTLSGTVHQESTREQAVKMAKKSKGVKSVKDQIEVMPSK